MTVANSCFKHSYDANDALWSNVTKIVVNLIMSRNFAGMRELRG
jgi:hypothetical protein